eukprot:gene63058-86265_t
MTELVVYLNDDIDNGYLALTTIAAAEFIFSGLFIKSKSLPVWMRPFMPSLSVIRWNMQANVINIYSGNVGPIGSSDNAFYILPSGYNTYFSYLSIFGWGGKTNAAHCVSGEILQIPRREEDFEPERVEESPDLSARLRQQRGREKNRR